MIRDKLHLILSQAVDRLIAKGTLPKVPYIAPEATDPRSPEHGDYATNFALVNATAFGMSPRQTAEALASELSSRPELESVEVAGPGFLNLRLQPKFISSIVAEVLERGRDLPRSNHPAPKKINVEFVSVNPNGPITVGSGRGAAFGSTLCNVLEAAGHQVHREYYINDGVNSEQMRLFAESVQSYVEGTPFPEKGYKGDYVQEVAEIIKSELAGKPENPDLGWYRRESERLMIKAQRAALEAFEVTFDTWFSEQSLHDNGMVARCLNELAAKGVADEEPYRTVLKMGKKGEIQEATREAQAQESEEYDVDINQDSRMADESNLQNTLWLRSTKFGDDMDRVLRRRDGRLTYIASDVAYHQDKFNRPPHADKLITVLGPDHHGYIGRLQAVVAALLETELQEKDGTPAWNDDVEPLIYRTPAERDACQAALAEAKSRLEVVIFQIVRFVKEGKPAPMRKRDGNIYALIDLIDELGKTMAPEADVDKQREIGRDLARFFYLMRSHDTHMDFDIDLATKKSDENPVFYVQYAHARICSVLRKADESGLTLPQPAEIDTGLLVHPKELALIKKIADLPYEVRRCAKDYGVHRLTTYAVDLARMYHGFYDNCRVIQPEDVALSRARLALCQTTAIALRSVLDLLGISAPESM